VKDHRYPASQGGSGAFEPEPFPQHDVPVGEARFAYGSESRTQRLHELTITASRDVAVVVDFSGLEAPWCEPEPGRNTDSGQLPLRLCAALPFAAGRNLNA
jgi:hypothetical protein